MFTPKTVEIYRTGVTDEVLAEKCISLLSSHFPDAIIDFDLEDTDNILRMESVVPINTGRIVELLDTIEVPCELYRDQ